MASTTMSLTVIATMLVSVRQSDFFAAAFSSPFVVPATNDHRSSFSPTVLHKAFAVDIASPEIVTLQSAKRTTEPLSSDDENSQQREPKPKTRRRRTNNNNNKNNNKNKNNGAASNNVTKVEGKRTDGKKKANNNNNNNSKQKPRTNKTKKRPVVRKSLRELKLGSTIDGKVVEITQFGALVQTKYDIGDKGWALLHVSQIRQERVDDVGDVLKKGDRVSPRVISIDHEKGRVRLSLRPKRAARTNLRDVETGKEMRGKVKLITEYGAFVDVGATCDCLVHVSRISMTKVTDVHDYLKVGEDVNVHVISVDTKKKTMAGSMLPQASDEYLDRRNRYFNKA